MLFCTAEDRRGLLSLCAETCKRLCNFRGVVLKAQHEDAKCDVPRLWASLEMYELEPQTTNQKPFAQSCELRRPCCFSLIQT